jgi:hypothetical protein
MASHDDELRELPKPALPRELDDRVRAAGSAAFERAHGRGIRDVWRPFARFGVPLALATTAAVYLTWAVQTASSLYE